MYVCFSIFCKIETIFRFSLSKMNFYNSKFFTRCLWIVITFTLWALLKVIWETDMRERGNGGDDSGGWLFITVLYVVFIFLTGLLFEIFPDITYTRLITYILLVVTSFTFSVTSAYTCSMKYNTNSRPLYRNTTTEFLFENMHNYAHYSFPPSFINTTLYGKSFTNNKFVTVYWITDKIVYKCDTGSTNIPIQGDGMVWAKGPVTDGSIFDAVKDLLQRNPHFNDTFDQFIALRISHRYTDGPYYEKYCEIFNYTFFSIMIVWGIVICIITLAEWLQKRKEKANTAPLEITPTSPEIEGAVI